MHTKSFYALICLFFLASAAHVVAQDQKQTDSLIQELQQFDIKTKTAGLSPGDTLKVQILINLVQNHFSSYPNKAFTYAFQQLAISEKLNYKWGIANACVSLGALYDLKSEYANALKHYQRALQLNKEIGNKLGEADCYFNISSLFGKQSNYTEALKYLHKGLAIASAIKDDFGLAGGYNNLGVLYQSIGNYTEALKAYFKCIPVMRRLKAFSAMATIYNNIGSIYLLQDKHDVAMEYLIMGLKMAQQYQNKEAEANNYHSMGETNFKEKRYDHSIDNYLSALRVRKEIGDSYGIAESYISIGKVYFALGNYSKAIAEIEKGLSLVKKSEPDLMLVAHKSLAEIYEASKNYKLAYKNHIRYKQITDSLFNTEKDQKFMQLQMQYDFKVASDSIKAVQDKKDLLAAAAIADQRNKRNFIVIGMGMVVIFLIILIWQRNKIAIVKRQKALEAERNRISRDLHDNLGAQLSTVRMFVSSLKKEGGHVVSETVDTSIGLLDESISDLRGIMQEMNSSVLLEKGYLAATEMLINKVNQLHTLQFSLTHHKMEDRPDAETEHQLYRITQELVNNTLKYADANNVSINVLRRNSNLILMYEDDGVGFDIAKVKKGYGLKNIESRVQSLSGTVAFDSMPNAGSCTIVEIPLRHG